MRYDYRVMEFSPQIKGGFKGRKGAFMAQTLEELCQLQSKQGFEFYRIDKVQLTENPGCLAIFSGGKPIYHYYDVAVFRRALEG